MASADAYSSSGSEMRSTPRRLPPLGKQVRIDVPHVPPDATGVTPPGIPGSEASPLPSEYASGASAAAAAAATAATSSGVAAAAAGTRDGHRGSFAFAGPTVSRDSILESKALKRDLQRLEPFVPRLAWRRAADIKRGVSSEDLPWCESLTGTVAFVDIAGFSKFTSDLTEKGATFGADSVSAEVNKIFSGLISIVQDHSGDVVKFAGDALIIVWPTWAMANADNVSFRSVLCMWHLQSALGNFHTRAGVPLKIRAGVAFGDVYSIHVGNDTRADILLAGDALDLCTNAAAAASPSTVFVTTGVWTRISDHFVGKALDKSGFVHVTALKKQAETELSATLGSTIGSTSTPTARSLPRSNKSLLHSTSAAAEAPGQSSSPSLAGLQLYGDPDCPPPDGNDVYDSSMSRQMSADASRPADRDELLQWLPMYVPTPVLSKYDTSQHGWSLNELRNVSVIFVHLDGFIFRDPSRDCRPLNDAYLAALNALAPHHGMMRQIIIDDKGCVLVCALGLPPAGSEDVEAKAIKTAMTLQESLRIIFRNKGVQCRLGVTSGKAFCGIIGINDRSEYTIIGDIVNMSARLMGAACRPAVEGASILCDHATYVAGQSRFRFKTLDPIRVKGKTVKQAVYLPLERVNEGAPLAKAKAAEERVPLLGRELEFARVLDLVDEGRPVAVTGAGGLGKSHLVEVVAQQLSSNHEVLSGGADPLESATPFHAWKPVLEAVFRKRVAIELPELMRDAASGRLSNNTSLIDSIRAVMKKVWPGSTEDEMSLLNVVFGPVFVESRVAREMDQQTRAQATRAMLAEVIVSFARLRDTVLVLEDAHHMDGASVALLGDLIDILDRERENPMGRTVKLSVILSSRPREDIRSAELAVLIKRRMEAVKVRPLNEDGVRDLIAQLLKVQTVDQALLDQIVLQSGGNAFFINALVAHYRDAKMLRIEANRASLSARALSSSVRISKGIGGASGSSTGGDATGSGARRKSWSSSLASVVTARFDRLPITDQQVLKVAAVLGTSFSAVHFQNVAEDVLDTKNLPALPKTLERLMRGNFLRRGINAEGQAIISFQHALLQEIIYDVIPDALRQQMHFMAAKHLEALFTDAAVMFAHISVLGYHWSNAGHIPQAAYYLSVAAEQSALGGASHEVIELVDQLLDMTRLDPLNKHFRVEPQTRTEVEGLTTGTGRHIKMGISRAQYVRWHRLRAEAEYNAGGEESFLWMTRALKLVGLSVPSTRAGMLLSSLLALAHLRRRYESMLKDDAAFEAMTKQPVDPHSPIPDALACLGTIARIAYFASDKLLAVWTVLVSWRMGDRYGMCPETVTLYCNVAMLAMVVMPRKLIEAAKTLTRRALQVSRATQSEIGGIYVNTVRGLMHLHIGHQQRSIDAFRSALRSAPAVSRRAFEAHVAMASALAWFGEFDESIECTENSIRISQRQNDQQGRVHATHAMLRALVLSRRLTDARAYVDELELHTYMARVDSVDQMQRFAFLCIGAFNLLLMYLEGGWDAETMLSPLAKTVGILESTSPGAFYLVFGVAAVSEIVFSELERGNQGACKRLAQRIVSRVIPRYTKGFPVVEARAHLWRGRWLAASGRRDRARAEYTKGLECARAMDLPYDVQLIENKMGTA